MATPTFQRISIGQFAELLQRFPFTRQINAVHMHHTWRPRHADFRGHETIVSMWRHHTQVNGWSDIAQHVTIDPEGMIWLGRNWNLPPASAAGHNGNKAFGPFMFEMIGDFDAGHDPFEGRQKDAATRVVALVQEHFKLPLPSLRFHNSMSPKSCPGSAISLEDILREVEHARQGIAAVAPRGMERAVPFPEETRLAVRDAIQALSRTRDNALESGDAELAHGEGPAAPETRAITPAAAPFVAAARSSGLSTADLAAMRPHLVNLRAGRLSAEGEFSSTPEDVDTIFQEHLPQALSEAPASEKLRLLFFAHGGLVSESSGLQIAHRHIDFWRRNGIYPIYFVWETGFFETVAQLLGRARQGTRAVTRDLADFTTDPIIEVAARALQGPRIWGGMKWSAERAADPPAPQGGPGGGAHYVATQLKQFCEAHAGRFELHAVGHSAGSIFHSHFLPLARQLGVPAFRSVHFMAPAVRVDTFKRQLLGAIGQGGVADHLTLYTMLRDYEREDNCAKAYRKSLLYLIYHALEDANRTPILGLEESLRGDADLRRLFGLAGAASADAEVIWSPSAGDSGSSASTSTSHGGFDDDAPTMNSVARRVLGKADADAIVPYAAMRAAPRAWGEEVDWPYGSTSAPAIGTFTAPALPPAPAIAAATPVRPQPAASGNGPLDGGRRVALCVGVDAYPTPEHRLSGCVNDARSWARTLGALGFQTTLLLDEDASRTRMERELERLVSESRAGDVIVFQYAGHGTHVPDLDGDEEDQTDEALCPVDFAAGALYIDDDIAELFARIPDGVNMTCFMDCCHSGTNTRFAVGLAPGEKTRPPGTRARFVRATPEIVAAHVRFRAQLPARGRSAGTGGRPHMRDVKFSACLDHQVALESAGNGEFTRRATKVLARGIDGMSHEQFLQSVLAEFGAGAQQDPMLDCAPDARSIALLQPFGIPVRAPRPPAAALAATGGDIALVQAVNVLAQAVQALSAR